jgi:hypothetical protein
MKLGHCGHALNGDIGTLSPPFPNLLPGCHEVNWLPLPHAPTMMFYATTDPKKHGLKPLKA